MKIYVVGSSKNKFLSLDNIREKFLIDQPHEGDNIDFLNPWYCELTGLYYLWKHVDDEIVGLEHYRRYFVNDKGNLLSENEIKDILKDYDIICRKWIFADHNQKNAYSCWDNKKLVYLKKFLLLLPLNEQEFYNKELLENSYFAQCNMFIGNSKIISEYMEWFLNYAIMFKKEELFNIPRIIGYISEFLFGAFLKKQNYKIKYIKSITYNQSLDKIIEDLE